MSKPFTPALSLILFISTFFAGSVLAAPANPDEKQPVEVTADKLVSQDKTGMSVYTGRVVIKQGSTEIHGDKVTLFHPHRKMEKAVILGQPATFKRYLPEEKSWVKGRAQKITYDTEKKTVLLEKEAFVNQEGKNSIAGPSILYNTLDKTLKAQGDKKRKKRVKVIFKPEETSEGAQ